MSSRYDPEVRRTVAKLHLGGRTARSLADEYKVSKNTILKWTNEFKQECEKENAQKDAQAKASEDTLALLEKTRQQQKRIDELEKENAFLKKTATYFAREIGSKPMNS